ncbi:MAG: CPBP family intramembrane glutamic endopeptidase [Candidatus Nanopelagicales bacterium]
MPASAMTGTVPTRPVHDPGHPVRTALALTAAAVVVTLVGAWVVDLLAPSADPLLRRLPVVLALMAMALLAARRIGWREVAAGGPSTWRSLYLLVVPALIALAPLAAGWSPEYAVLGALTLGYAATAVYEELWFRGVMLRSALPLGPVRAAVLTAVLFGASHLANVAFGANLAVTLAQAVGSAAGGFAYAVLRLRTRALWLLVAVHGVGDLLLHTTGLHGGMLWVALVGHDVALFACGLAALPRLRRAPYGASSTQTVAQGSASSRSSGMAPSHTSQRP